MSKYLDSNGLGYFWGKVKTHLNGKIDKPNSGSAGQVIVCDGAGNWGAGDIEQTTVTVTGTTLVISNN